MNSIYHRVSIRKYQDKPVKKIIGMPDSVRAFAIFPLGYPGEEKEQQDRFDASRTHWME